MFNSEYYPTPIFVIDRMIAGLDLRDVFVLEPSSGSGSIIDVLNNHRAKVICCEQNKDLATISASKANLIARDFFSVKREDVSHVKYIIANPPFSNVDKHILYMWEICPEGGEVISLCNHETYDNCYSNRRYSLKRLIDENGTYENLGDVFSDAERKTGVSVGLIHLYKPKTGDSEFDGFFDTTEEEEEQENGVMRYDEIRNIVNRYTGAVRIFDEVVESAIRMNDLINPINYHDKIKFGAFAKNDRADLRPIDRDTFKKELQKSAWKTVFAKMDMGKYVTTNVLSDINKMIEQQVNVPFSMRNIYRMIEMIVGTSESRMNKIIVEAFDLITRYHDENRYGIPGFKTNDQFMVNKKFILSWVIEHSYSGKMAKRHSSNGDTMEDIHKALCYVTGVRFNEDQSFSSFIRNIKYIDIDNNPIPYEVGKRMEKEGKYIRTENQYRNFGELYDWGFFKIRGYKKGTLHVEFKDESVWEKFNLMACKAKGWQLPETTEHSFRKKKKGVEIFKNK